mmetsp:Transcript_18803/g.56833  ORF Transcript_18803/g.56833 Transcript_18803/m.56833 type:complete len:249 (+) Transcript_18803:1677-2423(+)
MLAICVALTCRCVRQGAPAWTCRSARSSHGSASQVTSALRGRSLQHCGREAGGRHGFLKRGCLQPLSVYILHTSWCPTKQPWGRGCSRCRGWRACSWRTAGWCTRWAPTPAWHSWRAWCRTAGCRPPWRSCGCSLGPHPRRTGTARGWSGTCTCWSTPACAPSPCGPPPAAWPPPTSSCCRACCQSRVRASSSTPRTTSLTTETRSGETPLSSTRLCSAQFRAVSCNHTSSHLHEAAEICTFSGMWLQ